ncbi:MAG: hypothetical protein M1426_01535 [Patescibacteria group bacterium]|nr:hypothetical protein [Patescibacteria group bacterium]
MKRSIWALGAILVLLSQQTGGTKTGETESTGTDYTVNYTEILTKLGTGYSSETGDLYDESKLIKRMLLNIDVAKKTVSLNTTQAKLNDPNSDSELAGITAGPNDFAGNRVVLRKKIDQTDKTIYVIFGRNKNQEFLIGDNLVNPDGFIGGEWSKTFKFDKSMTDFLGTRDGDKTYLDKAIDYALMLAVTSAKDDGKTIPAAESWVIGRNEQGEKIEKTETEPEKKITEPVQADHTAVNQLADLLYQLAR